MTTVLILSFGPVQDFIAAARRSRDLWSGSWLLSEVCKAAALALNRQPDGVELVFPAVEKTDPANLLQPRSALSVANKLQITFTSQPSAAWIDELIRQAREAAQARLDQLAADTEERFNTRSKNTGLTLNQTLWHKQLIDYLECYAGWAAQDESTQEYSQAVRHANLALQARKATRGFAQLASHRDAEGFGVPKSSLDGARETVLVPAPSPELDRASAALQCELKLGLNEGEQLDCMGLIKRLAVDAEQFTPVSRIAADSWLRQLPEAEQGRLRTEYGEVYQAGKQLAEMADLLGLASRVTGNSGDYQTLPFDGALLYRARLAVAQRELNNLKNKQAQKDERLNTLAAALTTLADTLAPIWRAYGEPTPYMAVLQADGDQMGALLEHIKSPEDHQQVSQALARFAENAGQVARTHHGHVIYAGGDDVLALVPLDQAWGCADALRQSFAHTLAKCIKDIQLDLAPTNYPTLSVGLGIGHMQETLNTLRDLAKRAEQLAKGNLGPQPRNALGICLRSRNNAELSLRRRWDDHDGQAALQQWQQGFLQQLLPSRLAHDALALAAAGKRARHSAAMLEAEFIRLFARTEFRPNPEHIPEGSDTPETRTQARARWQRCLQDRLATLHKQHPSSTCELASAACELAHELYVSHWLASKTRQDLGELA